MSERIGIIDLGSNSARLVIFHIYHNSAYNLVYEQKESVRLSEGTDHTGMLQADTMEFALETLRIFADTCHRYDVGAKIAVATAAVRNAVNGQEFLKRVQAETGFTFDLLSGTEEAYYGFLGIINTLPEENFLQFDLGGGSIELAWVKNRQIQESISLPFGSVNTTEKFQTQDQINPKSLEELQKFMQKELGSIPWLKKAKGLPLVGTGGTIRTIAKIDQRRKKYPFPKLHNYRMGAISYSEIWKEMIQSNLKERKKISGLGSDRADIIVAGSTIIMALLDIIKAPNLVISGCGVRDGIFFDYYRKMEKKDVVIPDILAHSTRNMLNFYKADEEHAHQVESLSLDIFDTLRDRSEFTSRDRKLLSVASQLHDIGITINYYDHARHSAYLVENARLYGLSHREQMICAVLVAWHGGSRTKQVRRYYGQFLDESDWQRSRRMGLILALGEAMEFTQSGIVLGLREKLIGDLLKIRMICRIHPEQELRVMAPIISALEKEMNIKIELKIEIIQERSTTGETTRLLN